MAFGIFSASADITIGLLIAMGLEGLVEMHHDLREETDAKLRREIADNASSSPRFAVLSLNNGLT